MAKSKKKCRYSDEERANAVAAVAANGGNVQGTAKQLGIPAMTLKHWVASEHHPEATKNGELKKPILADQFEALAYKLVGVADGKAAALNAKDAVIAAGVAVDKMRLLRGQATTIAEHDLSTLTDEQLDRIDRAYADATGEAPIPAVVRSPREGPPPPTR